MQVQKTIAHGAAAAAVAADHLNLIFLSVMNPNMEFRSSESAHSVALYCSASPRLWIRIFHTGSCANILFHMVNFDTRCHDFGEHTHCLLKFQVSLIKNSSLRYRAVPIGKQF
jgi:hypothetical protein